MALAVADLSRNCNRVRHRLADTEMNRRQFFGMTAAAVAAAGLSPLLLPEKIIFLPPRWGWKPSQLGSGYMRQVSQYMINRDEFCWRYDALARDIWGKEHQHFVYFYSCYGSAPPSPEAAAFAFSETFKLQGLMAIHPSQSREFRLALPGGTNAKYV